MLVRWTSVKGKLTDVYYYIEIYNWLNIIKVIKYIYAMHKEVDYGSKRRIEKIKRKYGYE